MWNIQTDRKKEKTWSSSISFSLYTPAQENHIGCGAPRICRFYSTHSTYTLCRASYKFRLGHLSSCSVQLNTKIHLLYRHSLMVLLLILIVWEPFVVFKNNSKTVQQINIFIALIWCLRETGWSGNFNVNHGNNKKPLDDLFIFFHLRNYN